MKKLSRLLLVVSLAGFTAGALRAQLTATPHPAPAAGVATGFDYSRGDYGFGTDTEVFSVPLDLSYEHGAWIWRANFSYLTVKGPATVVGGGGGARPTSASESGVGDIYLSGTYRFGETLGPWHLDATARVKLPTADEARGLGTGETDGYGQVDIYRSFGRVTPFVSAGWREFGTSALYPLHSGVYGAAGAHFRPGDTTIVTLSLDWGERLLDGQDNTADALVAVTREVTTSWRVMLYALAGFSDASPNFAGGGRLTYRF
jgi:hypothetical protein